MALERCRIEKGRRGSSVKEETGLAARCYGRAVSLRAAVLSWLGKKKKKSAEVPARPQSEVNEVERTYMLLQYTRRSTACLYSLVALIGEGPHSLAKIFKDSVITHRKNC